MWAMFPFIITTLQACAALHFQPLLRASGEWPTYQLSPSHNAVVDGVQIPKPWRFNADGQINGGVAVAGGRIYFDTLSGNVVALDLFSGNEIWSQHFDNEVMSTPIVAHGLLFVGTGRNGNPADSKDTFVYDPNTIGTQENFWGRDGGDHIEALSAADGKKVWSYRTPGEDMPSPAYDGALLLFANGDAHAYGLDAISGAPKWRRFLSGITTMASATVKGERVFFSTCGKKLTGETLALDLSGNIVWRKPYGNCDASPTYGESKIFVSGVDGDKLPMGYGGRTVVAALDARSGKVLWTYSTGKPGLYTRVGSNERAIAGAYAEHTYFQSLPTSDEVAAFEAATGRVRWSFRTMAPVKMSPIVSAGYVYFGDTAGVFYKIAARTGELVTSRIFDKPFTTSPPVAVGSTILCADSSTLYAFRL